MSIACIRAYTPAEDFGPLPTGCTAGAELILYKSICRKTNPLMRLNPLLPAARAARALAAALLLGLAGGPAAAQAPALETSESPATAGYYRLSWELPGKEPARVELQESAEPTFAQAHRVYLGYDRATLVSGRGDGIYYYRIRRHPRDGEPAPWSGALAVEVAHHSLERAMVFFWVGAVVFLATLALIVGGALSGRRTRRRF